MKRFRPFLILLVLLALALPVSGRGLAQSCGATYTVQPGDTLYSIAEKCGVPWTALVGINFELSSPNRIWPGQILRLQAEAEIPTLTPFPALAVTGTPAPATGQAEPGGLSADGREYIVRRGDSLARIAMLYDTTVGALLFENPGLTERTRLRPGQHIFLPPGSAALRGWVGAAVTDPGRGQRLRFRALDFPPYSDVEFHLGRKPRAEGDDMDPVVTVTARSDARGAASVMIAIPSTARVGEEWIVEVTAPNEGVKAHSPTLIIR